MENSPKVYKFGEGVETNFLEFQKKDDFSANPVEEAEVVGVYSKKIPQLELK